MSKTVLLNLPTGKKIKLSGYEGDESIIGAIEASQGNYEINVMSKLIDIISANSVCLDVGANIGALSLAFADIANQGVVYSIEVGSSNYEYLMENVKQNGFNNIQPINIAVSDYNGTATFNYVEQVAGCSFISTTGVEAGKQETVKVTTIDDLIEELGIERLDFIKMDVEGGERKALIGAVNSIQKFRPSLIIEWNPETIRRFYGEEPNELFELLSSTWSYIEVLKDEEKLSVNSYDELCKVTNAGKGWEDLLCRF